MGGGGTICRCAGAEPHFTPAWRQPRTRSRRATAARCRTCLPGSVAPAMRQTDQAELARVAGDGQLALDVVEEPHALGVERVRPHDVLAGQQGELREGAARTRTGPLASGRSATRSMSVDTPYTGVPSARTMPISADRRAAVRRIHLAGDAQRVALRRRGRRARVQRLDRVDAGGLARRRADIGSRAPVAFSSWYAR